ncbi:MAG TPA: phosphotransferase family protein [Steroidobacteraceae bacterium]|jgi:aminoglycoside phosphotransferase (APT) family kinase protein
MGGEEFAGTMPVAEAQRFDEAALERYLIAHAPGFVPPLARVQQFRGGQSNPTFLLTAGDGQQFVLRRKPGGPLLPSAHAVDREYRVIGALHAAAFPVARPVCLCEDESVLGTMFYIMSYVAGRNFWDPSLPGMTSAQRGAIYDAMNQVLVQLHSLDVAEVGLADYGKPGNYFVRQIGRWSKQYRASQTEHIESMEKLLAWLPANIPAGDETTLVHGDYRIDNMIFDAHEPKVAAVVDWELSTLGHPLADLSYHVMLWRVEAGEIRGLRGLDLAALGIPTEEEYVATYCRRTGRAGIESRVWEFCMAYNMFRIACIRQGILRRVLDGTAASRHARETGGRARATADLAWRQIEENLGG